MLKIECKSLHSMSDEEINTEIEDGFIQTNPENADQPPIAIQGRFLGKERFKTVASFNLNQEEEWRFLRARRPVVVVLWNDKTGEPNFQNWRKVSKELTPSEFPKGNLDEIPQIYDESDPSQGPSLSTVLKMKLGLWC